MVGSGARGMVGVALQVAPEDAGFAALRDEFLDRYAARLTRESRVFAEMLPVLAALEAHPLPWGIVTNKASRFTTPVVHGLGLASRAAVVISGDTTPHAKPHPAPLLEAARRMRRAAGVVPLCRRRPARRAGRPCGRHAHRCGGLGLPRSGRADRRLERRCGDRAAR